jgi:hypothetical protein
MALLWLTFLAAATGWFVYKWLQAQKYADLPGPAWYLSLPLVGHAYLLGSNPCSKMVELRKKYGNLFRLDVGSFPTVHINSRALINEAFRKEEFSGRIWNEMPALTAILPHDKITGESYRLSIKTFLMITLTYKCSLGKPISGVIGSEGQVWYDQRKFMLKHLSDLGMGKKDSMEDVIWHDAEQIVTKMAQMEGKSVLAKVWKNVRLIQAALQLEPSFQKLFMPASNNVIWSLATGESHDHNDPATKHLTACLVKHFQDFNPNDIQLLLMSNSLLYTKLRKFLGLRTVMSSIKDIEKMVERAIDKALPDVKGNYIERGLADIEKEDGTSSFVKRNGKHQLVQQLIDLFAAGMVIVIHR